MRHRLLFASFFGAIALSACTATDLSSSRQSIACYDTTHGVVCVPVDAIDRVDRDVDGDGSLDRMVCGDTDDSTSDSDSDSNADCGGGDSASDSASDSDSTVDSADSADDSSVSDGDGDGNADGIDCDCLPPPGDPPPSPPPDDDPGPDDNPTP